MTLDRLCGLLLHVRRLSFTATSGGSTGWDGTGVGTVEVLHADGGAYTFHEGGTWRASAGEKDIAFHNVYRWTPLEEGRLRLEHLRFCETDPVYLFDLEQVSDNEWRSASPHLCREDHYAAVLVIEGERIVLRWSITGPRKRETLSKWTELI